MIRRVASCVLIGSIATLACAQQYPGKPVRLIVPFPPGGGSDVVGRLVAQKLSERIGQSVFVENRAGAGGSIGTEAAVRAAPDGYTVVLASTSEVAINPWLYAKLSYDPVKELVPITLIGSTPMVILMHPSMPVKTVPDLIALAKSRPGQINVASAGNGTITHLSGEMFRSQVGATWTHVPYKGAPPALIDLVSGQVQIMFSSLPAAMSFIKSGRLRALAVSSSTRSPSLPDVATVGESGVPGFDVVYWYGIFAPAAVPAPIAARLDKELTQALQQQDLVTGLANQGAVPGSMTQSQFASFVKSEAVKWGEVVKASGARAD